MLAHNYQPPEIQDLADLCGDSLELSIKASITNAEVILFCGVTFMAETASVLSPEKMVLLPCKDAGCPMADMVTPTQLKAKLAGLPPMPVVTYVNSSASVKAMSTICCTSANAVEVVNSLEAEEILMVPDRNLAQYTASKTNKKIHLWDGYCPIHDSLTPEDVQKVKKMRPSCGLSAAGVIRNPPSTPIPMPACFSPRLSLGDSELSKPGLTPKLTSGNMLGNTKLPAIH